MSSNVRLLLGLCCLTTLLGCSTVPDVDVLIRGGEVHDGTGGPAKVLDIGLCGDDICLLQSPGHKTVSARQIIDASGLVVSPGFIDPHTHSLEELQSDELNANLNYLFQGVTTVVNGNDGGGPTDIQSVLDDLNPQGIGTNLALYIGHGNLRLKVVGNVFRDASAEEMGQMKSLLRRGMEKGALGLSSGLYYVPGSFSPTSELIELAKVAAQYEGVYDTHLRDEGAFSVGLLSAIDEAIEIATKADIHLHLAHIKALGVDVWGQSSQAIGKIELAQRDGVSISADQYPWQASGTFMRSAVVPKWVMAGSKSIMKARMENPDLKPKIISEINENIRVRGGPESLVVTASDNQSWVGKSLEQLAQANQQNPAEQVVSMVLSGRTRVASFNMNMQDIENFMVKSWVVTSSDGTNGHPRKYASFPKKYREFVKDKKLMTLEDFIHRSSGYTAQILGLNDRGTIQLGKKADILLFDPLKYKEKASFDQWDRLSQGVEFLFVNGQMVIDRGEYKGVLAGRYVRPVRD